MSAHEDPITFICDVCGRDVPADEGGDDDMPGACSDCWIERHPEWALDNRPETALTAIKPMDPERLGRVRSHVTAAMVDAPPEDDGAEWWAIPGVPTSMVAALLADRDYHVQRADAAERERYDSINRKVVEEGRRLLAEREVARLRARVQVEAEDVERAGVTRQHVEAWLAANGWTTTAHTDGRLTFTLVRPRSTHYVHVDGWQFPWIANDLADRLGRLGLDILDEMATMEIDP